LPDSYVLIVGPEAETRQRLAGILAQAPYEVGQCGWDRLAAESQARPPDLLVLLEEAGALQPFIRSLKGNDATWDLPVIVALAEFSDTVAAWALEAGAGGWPSHPWIFSQSIQRRSVRATPISSWAADLLQKPFWSRTILENAKVRSDSEGNSPPSPRAVSMMPRRPRGPTQASPTTAGRGGVPLSGPGQHPPSKSGSKKIFMNPIDSERAWFQERTYHRRRERVNLTRFRSVLF